MHRGAQDKGGGLARFGRRRPAGLRAGPAGQARLGLACPGLAQPSKRALQNVWFSIGFIRFRDMVNQHVIYSEKPNAFSMILEAIFRFRTKLPSFDLGFYKVF